jgi:hypothetical protein
MLWPLGLSTVVARYAPLPMAWVIGETLMVAQDGIHMGIARYHPGIHERTPVHRVFGTQLRIFWIRVEVNMR